MTWAYVRPIIHRQYSSERTTEPVVRAYWHVVEGHQVAELDLSPGPDVPEARPVLHDPVADLRQVAAHGSGRTSAGRRPPSPAAGRTGACRSSAPGARPRSVATRSLASRIRFWAKPIPRNSGSVPTHITPLIGIVTEPYRIMPFGQVDVADHLAVHLGQQPLIGPVRRVAQGAQERLAIRPVEDVEQRLIDRFMIGFGTRGSTRPSRGRMAGEIRARRLSSVQPYWVVRRTGREPSAGCPGGFSASHETIVSFSLYVLVVGSAAM